ncbi:D-Ala-D-Ala carboxypeptidase family metallohydrolase [Streptomyces sp. VRA16 Mangrove soil]|uniref:D-Ala-D-Ala carboxypeptidase family metallohydrolase n=1 Tax=Streptomyces sp. VRA16 Mangrove soil TaxID=2817434 RepID=UPI001A9D95EA|nr:D-Ala-D-Ala carboxypeptidase family metallohydrolase [Streptomyces sp. VRA16 Mangrove soil]MBO1332753.1 peptidoglycan-binding protein [Streptomyces sp. VRA16 Mangrove soil]
MLRRHIRAMLTLVMLASLTTLGSAVTTGTAHADACYTWNRTLGQGTSGEDVRQLQIRVAGYPGYGGVLAVDGEYGPATKAAVTRFQQAYGLSADGIAGTQTFSKIYALQDSDCTPIHFTYGEMNRCNSDWSGGAVSATAAKANALQQMWKLEALRHALGDRALTTSSGFRSYSCNSAVGGASGSNHLYGRAIDLVGTPSFCEIVKQARNHGFNEILGPGYPGHSDHAHLGSQSSRYWSASSCGI